MNITVMKCIVNSKYTNIELKIESNILNYIISYVNIIIS